MATKKVSAQPVSSYSQFEKSFATANRVAKIRIMIASGTIAILAAAVLIGVILSLGELNGDVQKVFTNEAAMEQQTLSE